MRYLFFTVFIITLLLKLLPGNLQNMAFTMDQGRDLVDVRQIWEGRDLKLIGPTTSINGVHLGPLYYYLISLPYLLSSGHPISVLVWQIIFFHLSVFFFWYTFKKKNLNFATFISILILLSPISFYANRYFWNANFMISFAVIYFTLLLRHAQSILSPRQDFILGFVSGLSLQIEAAFGVLFLPFAFLNFFIRKLTLPQYSRLLLGFFLTLLPQIIFELAKGFPMTKIFLSEASGQTAILGEKMSLYDRYWERLGSFKLTLIHSSNINPDYLLPIFYVSLFFFILLLKKKTDTLSTNLAKTSFAFIIFSFIFYLFYSSTLKSWYVFSLSLVFCFYLGSIIFEVYSWSRLGKYLAFLFVSLLLWSFIKAQNEQLVISSKKSSDPSAYANQIQVVDDVYKQINNEAFYVYNYIPSVYDYPFQYLFWSHGLKKYGYSPNDLGYLPNQPEYIKNKNSFLVNQKVANSKTKTVLIIQKGNNSDYFGKWMGNFAHLCKISEVNYSFGQQVITLQVCPQK